MFEGITESLTGALSLFRKSGKLTEANMEEGLRAVRQALLEADVNYAVAQKFTDDVAKVAVGAQVLKSVKPFEQFVGIVHQELVNLMGPVDHSLHLLTGQVTVLMLCGLQGSGKTTTCGKLAKMLLEQGRRPMLVAADLQRPAAIEQLKVLGKDLGVSVYSEPQPTNAVRVCQNGVAAAKKEGASVVILDTAGRLHIDTDLMKELEEIDRKIGPQQVLLVSDSMTGQDAVNSAKAFNEALELDGVILTKLDGDTRGGAALSIKAVTGVPIKFIGVGEQLDRLEPFHPERMAGRILGMGDVVSLVEKAQREFDAEEMEAQQQKLLKGKFTLVDFRDQLKQIRKMGPLREIMKMIPGMGKAAEMLSSGDVDPEDDINRIEGMINSMTPRERENPELIEISRRRRIAQGSGVDPSDVNKLLKDFSHMAGMMKSMAGMGMMQKMKAVSQMGDMMSNPGAQMQSVKQRSKRGLADPRLAAEKKKKARKESKKQRKKNR